jgi:hypothetical protein
MAAVTPVMAVAASRPATMKDFMILSKLRHPDESQDPELRAGARVALDPGSSPG